MLHIPMAIHILVTDTTLAIFCTNGHLLPGAPMQTELTKEKKKTRNLEKIYPALTSGKKDRKTIL